MSHIELQGIARSVGGFRLGPLDLTLPTAGVVGLVGANGAGKSTLMRILATVDRQDAGDLLVDGEPVRGRRARTEYRRRLGYVPQDATLPQRASCLDLMHHLAWLKAIAPEGREAAVRQALASVDLLDRGTDKVGGLSGGMQRRLVLAQALLGSPRVLLLDEPTVGLDPQQRVSYRELIRRAASDATVLLATHLTEDVRVIAESLVVLDEGRVFFEGSVSSLEAMGHPEAAGDTDIERGLSALLDQERSAS